MRTCIAGGVLIGRALRGGRDLGVVGLVPVAHEGAFARERRALPHHPRLRAGRVPGAEVPRQHPLHRCERQVQHADARRLRVAPQLQPHQKQPSSTFLLSHIEAVFPCQPNKTVSASGCQAVLVDGQDTRVRTVVGATCKIACKIATLQHLDHVSAAHTKLYIE